MGPFASPCFVDRLPAKFHKMAPDIQAHTEKQSSQTREWLAGGIGDNPVESLFDPVTEFVVVSGL